MIMNKKNKIYLKNISIVFCSLISFNLFFLPVVLAEDIPSNGQESVEQNNTNENENKLKLKITLTPSYIIGPGDQISITDRTLRDLFGQVERYDVTVSSDGYISIPLPDGTQQNILAAGNTLDELATEVRNLYGKTLKNPLVYLQISRFRPINIYITGEVAKPGVYKIETTTTQAESGKTSATAINTFGLTLTQALQLAGGLKPRADITSVKITKGLNSENKIVDLKAFLDPKVAWQDLNLQSGDTIYISSTGVLENQAQTNVLLLGKLAYQEVPVSIIGEAKNSGNFIFSNDSTLLDAIGKVGGLNVVGTSKKIKLSRFDEKGIFRTQELNLDELLKKGTTFDQISLRPNDIIEIEASKGKEVRHFFRDTGNALITTVGNNLGGFIIQDNMFNRISRRSKAFGGSSLLNTGGGSSISIISAPGQ